MKLEAVVGSLCKVHRRVRQEPGPTRSDVVRMAGQSGLPCISEQLRGDHETCQAGLAGQLPSPSQSLVSRMKPVSCDVTARHSSAPRWFGEG